MAVSLLCLAGVQASPYFCQVERYQEPASDLLAAPPPISFADWTLESEDDLARTYRFAFPSARPSGDPANDLVVVRVMVPRDAPRPMPAAILLHYWGAVDSRTEVALARRLAARGIASAIMPLPYHLDRTPAGSRSGALAIRPDAGSIRETVAQAASDVRRLVDFLQTRPEIRGDRIGLAGTSLGAIIGSLPFAVDSRIRSAAFTLGGVGLAEILWRSPLVQEQRDQVRAAGWTQESLARELEPVEPVLRLRPLEPPRDALIIRARHDQVVPPESTDKLVEALGTPHVLMLESGHYGGFLVERNILRTVAGFLDATLHDRPYQAPSGISSVTLRVGIAYDPNRSIQVAGAVDVWRDGRFHFSPMVTPRGPEAWLGYTLRDEWALGLRFAGGASPTWGIFWNTIL
ncbi:MAG: hypothetical protein MH204_07450 [Fimbriimonadaceae bacterium]|nr:hypothetical protein [Fimbriimonadaceae bacterium]